MSLSIVQPCKPRRCHAPAPSHAPLPAIRFSLLFLVFLAVLPRAGAQALEPGGPVDFGSIAVGSGSLNYTISFAATTTTTISSVIVTENGAQNKDFELVSNTCTGTLYATDSCNVSVKFSPLQVGLRTGAISITDSFGVTVNRVFLHGIGLGPQLVFSPVTAAAVSSASLSPSTFKTSTAVYDGDGNLYFNDYLNGRILELTSAGAVSLVASQVGNLHSSMAINGAGVLYITSPDTGTVQVIVPGSSNATLSTSGSSSAGSVTLVSPSGIAVDAAGTIYIADSQTGKISRIAADGSSYSYLALTGLTTPLSSPYGLAIDNNFLYIADTGNGRIVEVSLGSGAATALTSVNTFSSNYGLAVDAAGSLVVSNAAGAGIEELTPTGTVFAFAADSNNTLASTPLGLLVTPSGDIVSSDADLGLVKITRSTGSLTFSTPTRVGHLDSTDGYETLTVQNSGNQPIQFSATDPAFSSAAFAGGPANTCPVLQSTSTPLSAGSTCTYSVGFTPSVVSTNSGTLTVVGAAVGSGLPISSFSNLTGTGITPVDTLKVVATPGSTAPGTPVSFTVTALEGATVITAFTGTVTFTMTDATGSFVNGVTYTFTSADAGVHTFTSGATFNTPGIYTITAHLNTITGTSNSVLVQYPSSAALTSTVNPVLINDNTTLTATVSSSASATVATGSITFMNGATGIGSCTLSGGVCSLPVSFTTAGVYPLTAVYGGDVNFATSTSAPVLSQIVTDFTAQINLTSTINPSFVDQSTSLTATVIAAPGQPGAGQPTGTVTFMDGAVNLGTATLGGGTAILPVSFATAGSHGLTAIYNGNLTFGPRTGNSYPQLVNDYSAQVGLTSSIDPSQPNQSTLLTATVSATPGQTGAGTPTGTVTFKSGAATLGACTLTAGVCTLSSSFTSGGSYSLTAVYNADAAFLGSTSPAVTQVVGSYVAGVSLAGSSNPAFSNNSITFTATVTAGAGQGTAPPPTGVVTFMDGSTPLGSATVVNGVATLASTFAATGSHPLTAIYSGDANFLTASSPRLIQIIEDFTIAVASGTPTAQTVLGGYSTVYTFTLAPLGGAVMAGAITFDVSGLPAGAATVFSPAALATGAAGGTVTLTVKPPAALQAHLDPGRNRPHPGTVEPYGPIALAFLVLPLAFNRRRRPAALFLWVLLGVSALGLTGCLSNSASGYYGNTPQTYNVTVTASSGPLTHSTAVTLTVQ